MNIFRDIIDYRLWLSCVLIVAGRKPLEKVGEAGLSFQSRFRKSVKSSIHRRSK